MFELKLYIACLLFSSCSITFLKFHKLVSTVNRVESSLLSVRPARRKMTLFDKLVMIMTSLLFTPTLASSIIDFQNDKHNSRPTACVLYYLFFYVCSKSVSSVLRFFQCQIFLSSIFNHGLLYRNIFYRLINCYLICVSNLC